MSDLFSRSLKKYYENVKHQIYVHDIEAGRGTRNDMTDLGRFFEDIEKVKNDMTDVEKLYNKLQESNEESKVIHNAKTIKELRFRMDSDVAQVIKRVKVIKGKIEALDKSNVAHRDILECGPGSSADRTRTCLVNGLRKKLKVMMDKFQALRAKMAAEYKETIERRYFAVTGERANEDLIENLISSGESERFLLKAIQEQGPGQILDTISETQERYNAVKKIEKNLMELHQLFLDMAVLVDSQGQQLNNIEIHMAHAKSYVRRGTEQLQEAKVYQKSSRKWICIAFGLGTCVLVLILLPVLSSVLARVL